MNGISDAKSLMYGNYLSLSLSRCEGSLDHEKTVNSRAPRRLPKFGSARRYSPWDRQSVSGMIADSDHHAQNSLSRDSRHSRPLGGRRPSPRQFRLPLTIRFLRYPRVWWLRDAKWLDLILRCNKASRCLHGQRIKMTISGGTTCAL
jgi:hypothetical protein